ncbi:cathelicidin antimicrobial peptide [Struthio camelus]|uniref:cathelicidin antimicrobial peptide n=1 Tax=Struthio camelus TaxID=8801 RepID=UPI003603EEA2
MEVGSSRRVDPSPKKQGCLVSPGGCSVGVGGSSRHTAKALPKGKTRSPHPGPRVPPATEHHLLRPYRHVVEEPLVGASPGVAQAAGVAQRGGGDKRGGEGVRPRRAAAMPGCWALLALVVLGVAEGSAAPLALTYPQVLAQAVDAFNQRAEVQNTFRLLSADPEPAPGVELSSLRGLNFTVMETECGPQARSRLDDCDFKENGVIKDCVGTVQLLQSSPEIDLRCVDASSDPTLVQRGRIGRFFSRIRRIRPSVHFDFRARGTLRLG